ncbi:hypothetical protein F5Y16DRAFT_416848 [Xylariaceae sp. FL0255]|nr:hypothetical protein F5Y16DRAFT_416848 [Xylariaceae sp. FL0255]
MSLRRERIPSSGLHVVYEPGGNDDTLVDIVLIHGFGGHPMRSWEYHHRPATSRTCPDPAARNASLRDLLKSTTSLGGRVPNGWPKILGRDESILPTPIFWPRDLLPAACHAARIMTWGYQLVRKETALVQAQGDIFAHASELVRELVKARSGTGERQRPIVFIAHSIGGAMIKEVLRQAESSGDAKMKDLLISTAATFFFGCPHQIGEQETFEEVVLSMASSTSNIKAVSPTLAALCAVYDSKWIFGSKAFVRLWHDYNFVVKTYHEVSSLGAYTEEDKLTQTRIASSMIGDSSEGAEVLLSDHANMCRFQSAADPGFQSLSLILKGIIRLERFKRRGLTAGENRCLQELTYPSIRNIQVFRGSDFPNTCNRVTNTKEFRDWYHRRHNGASSHVLWITGSHGSGKTTQIRQIQGWIKKEWAHSTTPTVSCTAGGRCLDRVFVASSYSDKARSVMAIRSMLAHLFITDPRLRRDLFLLLEGGFESSDVARFFLDNYINKEIRTGARRTFILIDAAADCETSCIRDLLIVLARMAENSDFSLCLTSHPALVPLPENITHLDLHGQNHEDIKLAVRSRLRAKWEESSVLVEKVVGKANGNFLWAELATNLLNELISGGAAQDLVDQVLGELPLDLDGLYEWILRTLSPKEQADAAIIMRWVMLSPEPMTLNDLRVAVRLTRRSTLRCLDPKGALDIGMPTSMRELQKKGKHFDSPSQFRRWLLAQTCHLLTTKPAADNIRALGLQLVLPIHESVQSFFLSGRGFAALSSGLELSSLPDPTEACHFGLVRTILAYLNTLDLSPLVSGQRILEEGPGYMSPEQSPTWRETVADQRKLIKSSYPFLQYAVDNLLYHLLSPRNLRYFLPQQALYKALSSNNYRIWRRWTALLGETDPASILEASKSAEDLLRPEFGACYRLERVFRAVGRLAMVDKGNLSAIKPLSPLSPATVSHINQHHIGLPEDVVASPSPTGVHRGPRSRGTVVLNRRKPS